jgi:hypothetical protein
MKQSQKGLLKAVRARVHEHEQNVRRALNKKDAQPITLNFTTTPSRRKLNQALWLLSIILGLTMFTLAEVVKVDRDTKALSTQLDRVEEALEYMAKVEVGCWKIQGAYNTRLYHQVRGARLDAALLTDHLDKAITDTQKLVKDIELPTRSRIDPLALEKRIKMLELKK